MCDFESTRELIVELKNGNYITMDSTIVGHRAPTKLELEAAKHLEKLMRIIDDMYGDHYVDYLDWYANRCRELEEELDKIRKEEVDHGTY